MTKSKNVPKKNINDLLSEVASQAKNSNRQVLVDVALRVVDDAAKGKIGKKDADTIYTEFRKGSTAADEGQGEQSRAVQVSKLSKIIEMGEELREQAKPILERVLDVHKHTNRGELKIKGAYEALVEAAREQLQHPREKLTEDKIRGFLLKSKPTDYEAVARDRLQSATDAVLKALRFRKNAKRMLQKILDDKTRGLGGGQP